MNDLIEVALITAIPGTIAALGSIWNHFGIQAVVKATDGINGRLQNQLEVKTTEAENQAKLTAKDTTIAALTKKVNGGDHGKEK